MRVWTEETVSRLREMAARRVIEVGCGTGLLLTRLGGAAENYIGLDFSGQVLKQLEMYLAKREDLQHVQLRRGLADDLSFAPDSSVDLVILNSITQYFPDIDYVVRALSEVVR